MTARFDVPRGWTRVRTIDAHVAGEPLRVVTGGYPAIPGATILDRRRYAREHLDRLRRALMLEPRGHADMYGCIPLPPATPDGHLGVLFLHNEGYSTMCGHGIIGLVTVGLDHGLFSLPDDGELRIDTPAGRVTATAEIAGGRVGRVSFLNVPSFVLERDHPLEVPGIGRLRADVAFGGAFYVYVEAADAGVEIVPQNHARLIEIGRRIRRAASEQCRVEHPAGDGALDFFYGTVLVGPARGDGVHSRNVCVFADGEVDRSPTGTGVSGRAAIHHARGELPVGRTITIESLIGTTFDVSVERPTTVGGRPGVVPRVRGSAWVTGRHEFVIDPADPVADGFLLR